MQAPAFDGITRELGERSSRRGVVRLLGSAVAMGAVALTLGGDAAARGTQRGKTKNQGQVAAQGKGAKITICYQNQTRTVKKKGWRKKYPGATLGACPIVDPIPPKPEPQPQPVACTRWLISGGPNQYDQILVDDDLSIFNLSRGGQGILTNDKDRKALPLPPVPFDANVGETLNIVGYDGGGCRSLGPLWLHCLATGQKRQIFTGYNQGSCVNGAGTFINQNVTVSL